MSNGQLSSNSQRVGTSLAISKKKSTELVFHVSLGFASTGVKYWVRLKERYKLIKCYTADTISPLLVDMDKRMETVPKEYPKPAVW